MIKKDAITLLKSIVISICYIKKKKPWFTRQMFGKKSEKLGPFDPNQLSLNFSGVDPDEPILQAAVDAAKEVAEQELSQISIKKEEKARRKHRSKAGSNRSASITSYL